MEKNCYIFFIHTAKENLSKKTCQGKLASVNDALYSLSFELPIRCHSERLTDFFRLLAVKTTSWPTESVNLRIQSFSSIVSSPKSCSPPSSC